MDVYLPQARLPGEWLRLPFAVPAYLTLKDAGDMRRDGPGRSMFYTRVGIDPSVVHVVGQEHTRDVAVAPRDTVELTQAGEHFRPAADGLVTNDPAAVLAVTVADCMPIYVADRASPARALLHSGWKGTGILENAIMAMRREYGCDPANLAVLMGPCISAEAYAVDEERAELFAAEWGDRAVVRNAGGPHLDLRAANEEICRRNGVDLVNVVNHCTLRDSRFASFRREGPERYSLMLALLAGEAELERSER